ncbi:MAG: hypothetical protein ACLR6I_01680 [Waltera sp.]
MNSRTLWNDNWYFAKTALGVNWEDRAALGAGDAAGRLASRLADL